MWFGEFLCQNDVVTNDQLINAMSQYHSSREPIGRLAIKSGMLTIREVQKILRIQADDPQPFGEVAMRLCLLSREQVEILIGRQSFIENIWEFMVRKGMLAKDTLNQSLVEYHKTNFGYIDRSISETSLAGMIG